ncbi:two-component sensor histidine kinase [Lentzea sp. NBRC 105346]|uniref:sensor histidine kinase n=1 Tax=Lentzea sp. NBRC 105346 TaxID=3032205 RepID=UPI0024A1DEBB|nr:HAMP domain-containing sensor histidine kinase [Lentzea sp. NBRC 105346]GLZ34075.1 two-component sensor histidine kinase [Lentzea sp. NBRC 105346]
MRRRGPGLRVRITLLTTGLVAVVSAVLLALGWVLVGRVFNSTPQFPTGSTVKVDGVDVEASVLNTVLAEQARADLLRAGVVAFVCMVVAAAILAWTFTGRLLRPVHDVTNAARRLSAESLGQRLRLEGPRDEVAELADTFDAMLDRLEAAFSAQQRFVANASHELRTPLSVIRTELDVTLADPDADEAELRRMAGVVRAASERAEQLVSALLLLARTDGLGLAVREPVDLAAVVDCAWKAVRDEAGSLRAVFHCAPAPAVGDPALLERIAGNLLENAVRHNVPGGWIETVTEGGPQGSFLRVSSSGQFIPPERVDEMFEPFRRGGRDRTAHTGTGLGLSIVRAAVAAHGGNVQAVAVPGGGLSVTVHLPSAPR